MDGLAAAAESVYPKPSESGMRPPIPLQRLLRIYFQHLWFNLSVPAVEEFLCDSVAMRNFVGPQAAPAETRRASSGICSSAAP